MKPGLISNNKMDVDWVHAKHACEFRLCPLPTCVELSNGPYLSIGKFRGTVLFTVFGFQAQSFRQLWTAHVPTLGPHIRHVFGMSPDKQVGRVAAWRIVAAMTNISTRLEGYAREYKRRSMRPHAVLPDPKLPVTVLDKPSGPRPAGIWPGALVNMPPKPDGGIGANLESATMPSDELHRDPLCTVVPPSGNGGDGGFTATATMATAKRNIFVHVFDCSTNNNQIQS